MTQQNDFELAKLDISYTDDEIQEVLQEVLAECELIVQLNRVNTQIVILLNREANNYINYLRVVQTIKKKLTS